MMERIDVHDLPHNERMDRLRAVLADHPDVVTAPTEPGSAPTVIPQVWWAASDGRATIIVGDPGPDDVSPIAGSTIAATVALFPPAIEGQAT